MEGSDMEAIQKYESTKGNFSKEAKNIIEWFRYY